MEKKKKLVIIDANAVIHRAFHALPPLKTKKGELVNAIYGFLLVFFKMINDFKPDYIAAAFDFPAPTFRHKKYKLYKATREKAPQELYDQIPKIKDILKVFKVKVLEKQGFEADDLLGTIAKLAVRKQIYPAVETIILTGDMDALQLVDKNTKVYALKKGVKDAVLYGEEEVKEKYGGLIPSQIVDYKALRGDPSDNIPGVSGVGPKTAIDLIKKFGSLENIYEEIRENTRKIQELKPTLIEKLQNCRDQAFVSKMLVQINKNVPVDFDFEKESWKSYDKDKAVSVLADYGFNTLVKRLQKIGKEENKNKNKDKDKDKDKDNLKLL